MHGRLIALTLFMTVVGLVFGCTGLGGPGVLGATIYNVHVNYEVAWRALEAVLKEDPTLFEVKSVRPPAGGEDGLVLGSKKAGSDVAIWVQPQGKDKHGQRRYGTLRPHNLAY